MKGLVALGKRGQALRLGIVTDRTFRWCERLRISSDARLGSRSRDTRGATIKIFLDRRQSGPMRLWGRLLARVAVIGAYALTLSACGSSGLSAQDRSAIGGALTRWAAASTPAQACAVMSSGFRFFTGRGNYFDCAGDLVQTLGPVTPQTTTVTAMVDQNGQVAVHTKVTGPGPHASKLEHQGVETFWFVRQHGAWRLNSIGVRVGLGPPPPGSPGTPPLKQSPPV